VLALRERILTPMNVQSLKEFVAGLSGKDKAQITAATRLSAVLQGSLGRVRLEAGLRHRLGVAKAGVQQAATFGDLCRVLGIEADSATAAETAQTEAVAQPAAIETNAGPGGVQVGIDVEPVAALPDAADYWEHEFYKSTFSPREIAYALLQPSPRQTFAGAWCAKEALRKARPALAQLEWTALEVVHDASGKPAMTVQGQAAGGALSISHAAELAVAVFVAAEAILPPPVNDEPPTAPLPPPTPNKTGPASLALALIALLLSLAALYFSVFHR